MGRDFAWGFAAGASFGVVAGDRAGLAGWLVFGSCVGAWRVWVLRRRVA